MTLKRAHPGGLSLTFLGTGAAFSRRRANSNLLIEAGGARLLVDCGFTATRQLETLGLSVGDITHILVTHLHADHVGGLEEVAIRARLQHGTQPVLLTSASLIERLWETSLRGGLEFLEETPGEIQSQTLTSYFKPQPIKPYEDVEIVPGFSLKMLPTYHVMGLESYGLLLEGPAEGAAPSRFAFTGDTRFDPDLIKRCLAWGGPLFHDCQLVDLGPNNSLSVHTSYSQLRTLTPEERARMWLYHLGDEALPDAEGDGFKGFVRDLQSFGF